MTPGELNRARSYRAIALILASFLGLVVQLPAESEAARRVKAGVRLFRTILAADRDIAEKRAPDGSLTLLVVSSRKDSLAEQVVEQLQFDEGKAVMVSGHPVVARMVSHEELAAHGSSPVAGIFITERIPEETLRRLVALCIDRHLIVYSPFEGDVERGILSGLSVEATVRPYINMSTLKASEMRIKPFFLRVAKLHE